MPYAPSQTAAYAVAVEEAAVTTRMDMTVSPAGTYYPGEPVTFTGKLVRTDTEAGIAGQTVTLAGDITGVSDITAPDGSWDLSFNAPSTIGTYSVYGSYGGGT